MVVGSGVVGLSVLVMFRFCWVVLWLLLLGSIVLLMLVVFRLLVLLVVMVRNL